MKSRVLKMGCVGIASVVCITLITFAESPPQVPIYPPTGWYWTGNGVWCDPPGFPCYGDWDDPNNWVFVPSNPAPWGYPDDPTDDAYLTWGEPQPLIVYLTTEEIDFLGIHGKSVVPTQSLTFESKGSDPQTLSCNHLTLRATNGDVVITVADNATIRTVD